MDVIEDQYSQLAISAMKMNAKSQDHGMSALSYSRIFVSGKPVSQFVCKACKSGLGHIAPGKCDRCGPFTAKKGSLERTVVGFTQLGKEMVMGEYMVS